MSSHYWYWIHTAENKVDLDDFHSRALHILSNESTRDNYVYRLRYANCIRLQKNYGPIIRLITISEYFHAKVVIELEETGLLHMVVEHSDDSISPAAYPEWMKTILESYPHCWYGKEDIYLLTSEKEDRADALKEIGESLYKVILENLDVRPSPEQFNDAAYDSKLYLIFSKQFIFFFPTLDAGVKDKLNHLFTNANELINHKIEHDNVYWNYCSTQKVGKLTVSTICFAMLSMAVGFTSGSLFDKNIPSTQISIATVLLAALFIIMSAAIIVIYHPFSNNEIRFSRGQRKMTLLDSRINRSNIEAQDYLEKGRLYSGGFGVEQSDVIAAEYYKKAADAGNPEAQFIMGVTYETGTGVDKSDPEAIKYYKMAVKNNHPGAANYLGDLYVRLVANMAEGEERDKYLAESKELYLVAVNGGDVYAMYNLGDLYKAEGDYETATTYFRMAAMHGDVDAMFNLARFYFEIGLSNLISEDDAVRYLEESISNGCSDSAELKAKLLREGRYPFESQLTSEEYENLAKKYKYRND